MRFQAFSALTLAALMSTSQLAFAAPAVNDAGAATLKKTVEDALQNYTRNAAADGKTLSTGSVSVAPKGSYYEIRIPSITTGTAVRKIDIGTVVVNASPTDNGNYVASMAIPTSMTINAQSGAPEYRVTLASQKFSGTFMPAVNSFIKINAEYGGVQIKSLNDNPLTIKVDNVKNILDLKPNADSTYSGYNDMTATGMSVTDKSADRRRDISASAGSMKTQVFYDKLDIMNARKSADKIANLYADGKTPGEQDIRNAQKDVISSLGGLLDAFNNKTEIKDVKISITPTPNAPALTNPDGSVVPNSPPMALSIASVTSGISARGVKQPQGSATLTMNTSNISFSPATDAFAGLIPHNINIDLSLDKLPMPQLINFFNHLTDKAAQSAISNDNTKTLAERTAAQKKLDQDMQEALNVLPSLLNKSGTTFTAKNTYIETKDLTANLEGTVKAANAPAGTTARTLPLQGTMTMTIRGIDELTAKLQKLAAEPNADPRYQTVAQMLTMIQMFGQPEQGKRSYKIEFTPDGKTLMNGADIGAAAGLLKSQP